MEKLDGMSLDIESVEKEKLKSIFPQCFVEGKLDVQKLLDLCGEYEIKDFERYEFTWHGKSECLKNAQTRSHGTLRPCVEESKNFDETGNLYIEGDNLEVLKLLQNSYYNKVKMIYIDPPYNTGKDFIYKDNFKDSLANYKEITSQATKSNSETMGRFHTDWLNMIYPRLRLAYNLLRDDGVIFISIDDNEVHNLRKVCDEVFGEENFISEVVRNTNSSKNQSLFFSVSHEYMIVYGKNKLSLNKKHSENKWCIKKNNVDEYIKRINELMKICNDYKEITEELKILTKYPRFIDFTNYWYLDERGVYRKDNLGGVKNGNMTPLFNPITNNYDNIPPGGFRYSTEKLNQLVEDGRVHFHEDGSLPTIKRYLLENIFQRPKSIQSDDQRPDYTLLKNFNTPFDNPKQLEFMKRIISIMDKDSVILDFFSGSATTAHAVMDLNKEDGGNRKFILVQLPELCEENTEAYKNGYKNICEIGKERIRRAGAKIEEEIKEHNEQLKIGEEEKPQVDTGFKVFKLDTSNVKIWDNTPIENVEEIEQIDMLTQRLNTMVETVKEDRTDLDLVYEILLKMGVELTESIIPHDFGNPTSKKGYIVREDALLIICLDKEVKAEHVAEMIEYAPSTIVFAEDSFESLEEIENAKIQVNEKLGYEFGEKVKFRFV